MYCRISFFCWKYGLQVREVGPELRLTQLRFRSFPSTKAFYATRRDFIKAPWPILCLGIPAGMPQFGTFWSHLSNKAYSLTSCCLPTWPLDCSHVGGQHDVTWKRFIFNQVQSISLFSIYIKMKSFGLENFLKGQKCCKWVTCVALLPWKLCGKGAVQKVWPRKCRVK